MELLAAPSEHWDVARFVNRLLGEREQGVSVDERASSLVLQLQLQQLELNAKLEEAAFDATAAIPKVSRELERVQEDAEELRTRMGAIEASLASVEASTERTVALLVELDRVKRNMELCQSALREAERFLALTKSIEGAQLNDFRSVVAQIKEVRSSLHMLTSVPEFRNATARLAQYEKRLESHLKPKFVAALRAQDVNTVLELAAVYHDIQQVHSMRTAYCEARAEEMQQWYNSQQAALTAQAAYAAWLSTFYDRLQKLVASEAEWCQHLFGRNEKRSGQVELAKHLLLHFSKSIAARIETAPLMTVVEVHKSAKSLLEHLIADVEAALQAPFAHHISAYGQLERETLLQAFSAKFGSSTSVYSEELFEIAEQAVERCLSLTNFAQKEGLVSALEALFALVKPVSVSASSVDASGSSSGLQKSGIAFSTSASTHFDQWAQVHSALKALAAAKSSYEKICAFDSRVRARLLAGPATSSALLEKLAGNASLPVLPLTEKHAAAAIDAARSAVFDAIFGSVRSSLAGFSKLPVWARSDNAQDPDLPKLRPDPSAAVTAVIEHLFALPHHLENLDSQTQDDGAEYWINLVAKAAVDLFVVEAQQIPKLSATGKVQLQTDVDALSNLLSALGVESPQCKRSLQGLKE